MCKDCDMASSNPSVESLFNRQHKWTDMDGNGLVTQDVLPLATVKAQSEVWVCPVVAQVRPH